MIVLNKPHSEKIVMFGQSCVGKTTMAKQIIDHEHICFDAIFHWHLIETLGLSCEINLKNVALQCNQSLFVLDGWHLSDKDGKLLPEDATIYLIYADYKDIIKQYRVPLLDEQECYNMFKKWYSIDYDRFPKIRYFLNKMVFVEKTADEFNVWKQKEVFHVCNEHEITI